MSATIAIAQAPNFLIQLVTAAERTTLLAAVAGLLLRVLRFKQTSARLFTWKAVLFAGLTMPLITLVAPSMPMPFPMTMTLSTLRTTGGLNQAFAPINAADSGHLPQTGAEPPQFQKPQAGQSTASAGQYSAGTSETSIDRTIAIVSSIYVLVAAFLFVRLAIGLVFARRLVRSARPIHTGHVPVSQLQVGAQLRAVPVYESALVAVPITLGAFAPTILLPLSWREWDEAKLRSVMSHEQSHAIRLDGLTKLVSLVHRAIFWFSPLAWWLNRYISELVEEASDEAALSAGAEPNQYARSLLGFFDTIQGASTRVRWQGVSMATSGNPERRLEKIIAWRGDTTMKAKKWIVALAVAVGLPATYVIAVANPVQNQQQNANPPQQQSSTPSAAVPGAPEMPPAPAAPSISPAPAMPSAPPAPATEQNSGTSHRHGYFYSYGSDDEQRFVIVSGKMDAFTMSGSSEDARHVENLRKQISGDFIWFQRDEKSYIIRDQATVERARKLWAPQEELGKKQEALGKQQEALGKQQEELGARMQQVRVELPDISAELDKLKAELKQLGPNASMEQIGRIQSEIGELQSRIGEIQSHAGDEQGKIGEEMGALGEQQGKLGEQQGELGRQQGELAEKANKEMKKLLDDAIKSGIAKPELEQSGGASL